MALLSTPPPPSVNIKFGDNYSFAFRQSHITETLDIFLEEDVLLLKAATHLIKCNIEVHVPEGYYAQLSSEKLSALDLIITDSEIFHGSHIKKLKFYLHNRSNQWKTLKKGDCIGKLYMYKIPPPQPYFYAMCGDKRN